MPAALGRAGSTGVQRKRQAPHLVLCEQDEPCHQDINDVSQT